MNAPIDLPTAAKPAQPSFGADRLARIAELEAAHFWFVGRRALVKRLLEAHVGTRAGAALDVGCGTGSFLPLLERFADDVVGIDPHGGSPDGRIVRGEAEQLPFEDAAFDLVVALDVLEHVDDRAAVAELARVVRPGGCAIVTVPAFPILWSERDKRAAHLRRYRRSQLVELLETAHFRVIETTYYQFLLFPLLLLSRIAGRLRSRAADFEEQPRPRLNDVLRNISKLEVRLGKRIRWPWGSTLAVVARRATA